MPVKYYICGLALMLFTLCAMATEQKTAFESVRESTDELLKRLVEVKPIYNSDPDMFYAEVQRALSPHVDFEGFSKRVMAKHYRDATAAQKAKFVTTFQSSLVRTYASALVEFDNEKVIVVSPTTPEESDDRATIDLEIHTKSGTIYPVQYQLELIEGRWMLRNVIINGINIGLQFRSQFNAYMQKYRKNIDKVIENWSVDVETQA